MISANGNTLEKYAPTNKMVLDPRVAYLVDSVLQDVMNKGTGAAVRARGFKLPAAGKTGTSRDGWFAGFTSNLVCVIWIGFDDNHDIGLNGRRYGRADLGGFYDQATKLPGYRDVRSLRSPKAWTPPTIDPRVIASRHPELSDHPRRSIRRRSQPTQLCELHGGQTSPACWIFPFTHFWRRLTKTSGNPATRCASRSCRGNPWRSACRLGFPADQGPRKERCFTEDFWYLWGQEKERSRDTTSGQRRLAMTKHFLAVPAQVSSSFPQ